MITIKYPHNNKQINGWKERLDQMFFKYEAAEDNTLIEAKLTDGDKQFVGVAAIENYLDELQQLVNGWYEDRCDRHDFDPDAATPLSAN